MSAAGTSGFSFAALAGRRGLMIVAATVAVAVGGFAIFASGGSNGSKGGVRTPGSATSPTSPAANGGNGASSGNRSSSLTPHAPRNNVVNIYNVFGLYDVDTPILDGLTKRFDSEGYKVTEYKDMTEGAGSQGGATLANFVGMAKRASVIIINAHGADFSGNEQACSRGKSISRCTAGIDPNPPSTTTTTLPATTTTTKPEALSPTLQVEWYPTWVAERAAYSRYVASGYDPSWLFDPYDPANNQVIWAQTLIPWRVGDHAPSNAQGKPITTGQGERPWLGITAKGIAHFFHGANIDLIDNLACHSIALATSFNARSYFGHASTACAGFEAQDEPTLFDRLIGKSGVPARPTTKAFALGGFKDKYFQLADNAQAVVLSPAVESVAPRNQAHVGRATNSKASVVFDAVMDETSPESVVSIRGCDAKIQGARWSDDHTLAFEIAVPKSPTTTLATLTIRNDHAKAAPGTDTNHDLDGNAEPPSSSGLAPNRDDYTWQVSCGTGVRVQIRSVGTIRTNFDTSGAHGTYHYQLDYKWDAARVFEVEFGADGSFTATPIGSGTLTANGRTSSSPDPDASSVCQWVAAANPSVPITIRGGGAVNKGSGIVRLFQAAAGMPISPKFPDPAYRGAQPLVVSGSCLANLHGPLPYLYQNTAGGVYDPGGQLGRLIAGDLGDVDIDALAKRPVSAAFPVDYTQTAAGIGGVEHVVARGAVTVISLG